MSDDTDPWKRLRDIESAHPEAPHEVSGGLAKHLPDAQPWIAGFEGTVIGYGPTCQEAVEDALDTCNAGSDHADGLDVLPTTPALARLLGDVLVTYVVRDGFADAKPLK